MLNKSNKVLKFRNKLKTRDRVIVLLTLGGLFYAMVIATKKEKKGR